MQGVPLEFSLVPPPAGEQPAPLHLVLKSEHWQLLRPHDPADGLPASVKCVDPNDE